jgi:hypothetical protein
MLGKWANQLPRGGLSAASSIPGANAGAGQSSSKSPILLLLSLLREWSAKPISGHAQGLKERRGDSSRESGPANTPGEYIHAYPLAQTTSSGMGTKARRGGSISAHEQGRQFPILSAGPRPESCRWLRKHTCLPLRDMLPRDCCFVRAKFMDYSHTSAQSPGYT